MLSLCLVWVEVLCWIDRVWSSKECACSACDPSVHLSVLSIGFVYVFVCRKLLLLSTHSHDPLLVGGEDSDVPACGPPASFSIHLASSAVTLAGSVHKSRGDNVVRMWMQLKR